MRNTTNGKIKIGTEELSNVNSSNIKQVKVDGSSVKYTTDNITWKEVGSGSAFVINGTVSGETISITETASKIIEAFNKKMIMILHVVEFDIVLDQASFDNISNTYSFSNYNLEKTALGVMSKKVTININENGVVSGFYQIEPLVFETQPILYGISPSLNEIEFNKHLLYQNNGELSYLEKEPPTTITPIKLTSALFNGCSWTNSVYYENFVYRFDNEILRKINVLTYQKEEYTLPAGSYYTQPCAHNGFIYAPSVSTSHTKKLLIFNTKDNSYTETEDSAFAYDCYFSFYYDNKIYSNLGVYDLTTKTFSALPSFLPMCSGTYKNIYTFFNNGKLWYIVNDTYYVINMETQVVEKKVIYASSPTNLYTYWANVGDYMYRISRVALQITISRSSLYSDNFDKSFEDICSVTSALYDGKIIGTSDALFFNDYKVPLYVYVLKTLGLKV